MVRVAADGTATAEFLQIYKPKDAALINELLQAHIPELRISRYGAYPMKQDTWLPINSGTSTGEPAFIPADSQVKYRDDADYNKEIPIKKDYVFGTGPTGFGYYHLLTRQAYVILNTRIVKAKSAKADYKNWLKGDHDRFTTESDKAMMDKLGKFLYRRSHEMQGPNEFERSIGYGSKIVVNGEMC